MLQYRGSSTLAPHRYVCGSHVPWRSPLVDLIHHRGVYRRTRHADQLWRHTTLASVDRVEAVRRGDAGVHDRGGVSRVRIAPRLLTSYILCCRTVECLDQCVSEHQNDMNHIHVSAAITSLVKLPQAGKTTTSRHNLMRHLLDMLMQPQQPGGTARIQLLGSREVANVLWATAKAGHGEHAVFSRLLDNVSSLLHELNALDTSNIIYGCAIVGRLDPDLAQQLCGRVMAIDLDTFKPQELSNILWACATAGCLESNFAEHICKGVTSRDLTSFKPQELANILWSYSTAGCLDSFFTDHMCRHVATRDLSTFNAQDLSNIQWACAKAGTLQPAFANKLCDYAVRISFRNFIPQAYSNMVLACATAGVYNRGFMDAVAKAVLGGGMMGANPQNWSNLLWGYVTLRHSSPNLFLRALALMEPLWNQCNSENVANLVWAYAAGVPDDLLAEVINGAANRAVDLMKECNAQDLSNMAWSVAVARHLPSCSHSLSRLTAALLVEASQRKTASFTDNELCQWHQLFWEVDHASYHPDGDRPIIPAGLRDCARQARVSQLQQNRSSTACRQIFAVMKAMGLDVLLEQPSPCGNFSVDLLVTLPAAGGGIWAVPLEVDGPTHHMRNDADMMDGATRWRDRHLSRSYGTPVVTINLEKERLDWSDPGNLKCQGRIRELLGL